MAEEPASGRSRTVTGTLSSLTPFRRPYLARRGETFALAGLGLLLGFAVVVSWGRLGPEPGSRNPTTWLGLLAVVTPNDASKAALLFLLVPALFLLLLTWWFLQRLASSGQLSTKAAAVISGCWALPFVIGPVIGSRDAYAYVAQGELARRGFDPTRAVVSQLGPGPLLAAVDPRWRDTRPPYGGVAVAIQKVASSADSREAISLLLLRLIALCAVVVLVVVTARMATPAGRPIVIASVAANPLVMLHLIAGAHLDAVAAALLVSGLAIAARAGAKRSGAERSEPARSLGSTAGSRWLGIFLCSLGAMVKLPVALGAVYLSLCALVAAGPTLAARLRGLAGDVLAAATAIGLSMLVSDAGLGWLRNFGTPGRLRTGIAPADIGANLVDGLGHLVGLDPSDSGVLSASRLVALTIGVAVAGLLLLPRRAKGLGPDRTWVAPSQDRLGLALLALGLLGPVLYGWYLAPALPLLALAAARPRELRRPAGGDLPAGAASAIIIGLSAVLTFATMPSLGPVWTTLKNHPGAIVVLCVAAALVVAAAGVLLGRALTRRAHPAPVG